MIRFVLSVTALVAAFALTPPAHGQTVAPIKVWVSGSGSDANPCSTARRAGLLSQQPDQQQRARQTDGHFQVGHITNDGASAVGGPSKLTG